MRTVEKNVLFAFGRSCRCWPVILLAVSLLSACALRYDITLNNGIKWTNVTKPKLDPNTGNYVFTDGFGRTVRIKESRVSVIEPHEESSDPSSQFKGRSDLPKSSSN